MTFTATIELNPSPGPLEELLDGCAGVVVEFEADVQTYPGEGYYLGMPWSWSDCDASSVDIQEVWLEVECEHCAERWNRACYGVRRKHGNILPTLSAPDLARLKKDCAEWAREHAVEQQAHS